MGVSEIEVSSNEEEGSLNYHVVTKKPFNYHDKEIKFSNYDVKVSKNSISLKENYSVSLDKDGDFYLNTPDYSGKLSNVKNNIVQQPQTLLLGIWTYELTQSSGVKSEYGGPGGCIGSCSFWNTYTVVGVGATSSAAFAECQSQATSETTASGSLENCDNIGNPTEEVDMPGFHVVAQSFCCD